MCVWLRYGDYRQSNNAVPFFAMLSNHLRELRTAIRAVGVWKLNSRP